MLLLHTRNLNNMDMRKYLLITMLLLSALSVLAKRVEGTMKVEYPGGKCYLYRLYLSDKKNSPYTLDRPLEFLSQRAINRRNRQHLQLNESDLPVSPAYVKAVSEQRLEVVGRSKWNNTLLIRVHSLRALKGLSKLPFISSYKKVFESPDSIREHIRSNYHSKLNTWDNLPDLYGASNDQIKSLDGIKLHEKGYWGKGMLIAVLDGGFMNVDKIPALHDLKLHGIKDFVVPRSSNIFEEMDHGTMVLSTMAVNQPHYYIGTAPEASYLLIRCEDEQTESLAEEDYWAEAVEYADSCGVDVINSSLGYHAFDDKSMNFTYQQQDGNTTLISRTASMLADKGIVLVNSAGNDGMGSWKRINFPADAKDILTVGSITEKGINAPFSSIGPTADGRIKPDVMAYGSPVSVITGRGTILNDMGTSFSSPLIAGMVACLWQAMPDKTAKEIIRIVKLSGNRASHPDNVFGYGIPDFGKAMEN